ncbi:MAG: NAD-dependent epimerase/dehydratase family protein [Myxococcales bacterium]|nr:NAD-dependent epimerase/dehydratase family protein [Myxococcales bacterium]
MNWLITGGCGFIGARLIARLRAEGGHAIRVLDNLSVGSRADLDTVAEHTVHGLDRVPELTPEQPVQLLVGDIRDPAADRAAVQGVDVIVHLAANTGVIPSIESPDFDCETNVLGTVRVLEAAREAGVTRFVLASSGAPLGEQTPPIHEEKLPKPVSPYGASKLAGEAYCRVYHACFGTRTVALRFGNVYGPGSANKGSLVAKLIKQALGGERWTIYGDGTQTRDFIYIDDLIDAIVRAAQVQTGGEIFQIATGAETTVNEVADQLETQLQLQGVSVSRGNEPARTGEVLRNYADIGKAREMLGWEPSHTLASGLARTVEWFLEQRAS